MFPVVFDATLYLSHHQTLVKHQIYLLFYKLRKQFAKNISDRCKAMWKHGSQYVFTQKTTQVKFRILLMSFDIKVASTSILLTLINAPFLKNAAPPRRLLGIIRYIYRNQKQIVSSNLSVHSYITDRTLYLYHISYNTTHHIPVLYIPHIIYSVPTCTGTLPVLFNPTPRMTS